MSRLMEATCYVSSSLLNGNEIDTQNETWLHQSSSSNYISVLAPFLIQIKIGMCFAKLTLRVGKLTYQVASIS